MKGKGFGFKFCQFLAVVALLVASCVLVFVSPVMAADKPVWRVLFVILPEVEVPLDDGFLIKQSMTAKEIEDARSIGSRTQQFMNAAVGDAVEFVFDIKVASDKVTQLTGKDISSRLHVMPDDYPADIKAAIQQAKDEDNPYQLFISTVRLYGSEYDSHITGASGLTGVMHSTVILPESWLDWWAQVDPILQPYPELLWVHELLHQIVNYFEDYYYYPMPDIHHPEYYGFDGSNGAGSVGNQDYYRAVLGGQLTDANTGQTVGIAPEMWPLLPSQIVPDMANPTTPDTPSPTPPSPSNSNDSGGGCDTGLPIYALLALLALRRKRS